MRLKSVYFCTARVLPAEYEDPLLLVPGPAQLTPPARRHVLRHVGHRSEMFRKTLRETVELLKQVFKTSGEVHIFTASGTGAVEAAVMNFVKPDDKVVALVCGTFSRRFAEQASRVCPNVYQLRTRPGEVPTLDQVRKFVEEQRLREIDVFLVVFNETNPGVALRNLPEIVKYAHSLGAIVLVDNVSGLGGDYFSCDDWDIDVALSSSQKCLGAPPGLSFLTLRTPEAERKLQETKCVSTYFDIKLSRKFLEKWETPFTPAVNLIFALRDSLDFIVNSIGLDKWIRWHVTRARLIVNALTRLGLKPFVEDENTRSVTVLSFAYPQGVDPAKFRSQLYRLFNVEVADGMDELRGKIFRIGNMGWLTRRDLLLLISGIVACIKSLNPDFSAPELDVVLKEVAETELLV